MRTYGRIGRWILPGVLLGAVGCQDTHAFRDYECGTPAPGAVDTAADALTPYTVSDAAWDEAAVRQVLHVFAFGGYATDAQITAWADMPPNAAIAEMFTFETVNDKLSPPASDTPQIARRNASLRCLSGMFALDSQDNPIPSADRSGYSIDEYDAVARTWGMAVRVRGLNTFRQRIGFFETNYHLAVSSNSGVTNRQLFAYYDAIMNDLAQGLPYERVLTHAALSAAVARQYDHRHNVYQNGKFDGNEDFGREYHQLFFGILGNYDDAYTGAMAGYHELVTIPSTARALTDMQVSDTVSLGDTVTFGTAEHFPGTLSILETSNTGTTARERFEALAPVPIAHPESLANLPVLIVRMLADDLLDPNSADPAVQARVTTVRALWGGMTTKNLLEFLRKYAISTAFHDSSRVKYWTSIERNVLVNNLTTISNRESFQNRYSPGNWMYNEDVALFRPTHDVFGGQTGLEAANTADVFREAYNRSVDSYWSLTDVSEDVNGLPYWRKDWSTAAPRDVGGGFSTKTVAEWLWSRYMADGLANFGMLERAHMYALLASGHDLGYWLNSSNPTATVTLDQINNDLTIHNTVVQAEGAPIFLESTDPDTRVEANRRISLAVNFIVATPYFMAQTGR